MNCYNGEKYLREALESVLVQTYQNWELIFWDNQSNDNSKEIVNSYEDDRVKYFCAPKHTLLYEARNYAIKKASGEFYAFLDVDDWWKEDKLAKQMLLFKDSAVGLVYGKYLIVNSHNTKARTPLFCVFKLPTGYVTKELLRNYSVGLLTIIIRKIAFKSVKGFDPRFHIIGDYDLSIKISLKYKFACVQENIAFYRLHSDSELSKGRDKYINELQLWYDHNYGCITNNWNIDPIRTLILNEKALLAFRNKKFFILINLIVTCKTTRESLGIFTYLLINMRTLQIFKIFILTFIDKFGGYFSENNGK
jgi:glycosyltransferase involved in cell wall biosynthesis